MKKLGKEEIQEKYISNSLIYAKASLDGNYKKTNRQYHKLIKLYKYLKEDLELAKEVLPELFKHENANVRAEAACHCLYLGIYVEEAQKVLYDVTNYEEDTLENRMIAFDANMVLKLWKEGKLNPPEKW